MHFSVAELLLLVHFFPHSVILLWHRWLNTENYRGSLFISPYYRFFGGPSLKTKNLNHAVALEAQVALVDIFLLVL